MGVLDSVLAYKKQKDAEARADMDAIPAGINAFVAAKQVAQKSMLDQLTYNMQLQKFNMDAQRQPYELAKLKLEADRAPLEQEKLKQETDLLKNQSEMYKKFASGNQITDDFGNVTSSAIPKDADPNDYIQEPTTRSFKGVPVTINVPKLKPPVQSKDFEDFKSLQTVGLELKQNIEQLTKNKEEFSKLMGPLKLEAQRPGGFLGDIGNLMLKMSKDPNKAEFAVFKAETDKAFQKFRKETTGAQAALKELGWIAPDLPEATDSPELYARKADVALRKMDEAQNMLLDMYSQRGFRTGELRKGLNKSPNNTVSSSNNVQKPSAKEIADARSKGFTKWSPTKGWSK